MRNIVTISLLFISGCLYAQNTKSLGIATEGLVKALIVRDSTALKNLLDDNLVYGHSNAWLQSKQEVINDLFSGKLIYKKIEEADKQVTMEGKTACVRTNINIEVLMENKPLQIKLHALQVWVWKNKKWQLLSRQSTKI